jgi:fatty-acyl-CoA synthase
MVGYLDAGARSPVHDAKLRDNPFQGEQDPAPLAVFTGDMGYLDDEGYLFLRGRRDGMVKVMGNRVYPQEVAHHLTAIPGVLDAAVTGVLRPDGQSELVAFLTVQAGTDLPADVVRKALGTKVPAFMLPSRIVLVDEIPRTASGKPDQRRLVDELAAGGSRAHSG